ncbi:glycoside hydrolase family 15 [Cellulomonas sp.]|uniref:glycoside hydrolase family 15 n=1 Tax=Cellulomonas sp. TaxID=40001 RepID=UPI002D28F61C|nr:glycoside hydrolase family 15 [Cellulomonas sp.]HYQ73761.1 glycoside hydrolase family 15 [Cellulomonas sp.]
MHRRPAVAAVVLATLAAGLIAWGGTGPRTRTIDLYSEGVVATPSGPELVPAGAEPLLHEGTRVEIDPATTADDDLAAEQRAWLAAGTVPGADGPYADMVTDALLDLHTLVQDGGAAVAAWTPYWRYVWPRDASFVAVALARTGHPADAREVLGFLTRVQAADGSFEARYLPDGSGGVPDDRAPQTDGTGWSLWAAGQVVAATPAEERAAVAAELAPLVRRGAAHAVSLVAGDGLPPASPDYWEVDEDELTLGTVAPLLAGLEAAGPVLDLLGDAEAAADAREAAARTRAAVEREFGDDSDYGRYASGSLADAASAFALPPFQPTALAGAADDWRASAEAMARPAGGLAPGAGWRQDGISWTPQTSLYALTAAANGDDAQAHARLAWLDAHRTTMGALPEKVLADGSPAAVAPLAWTAACVVLAVAALDG